MAGGPTQPAPPARARQGWTHGSPQAWRTRPAHRQAHCRPTPRPRQPAGLPPRRHPRPPLAHGVAHRLSGGCSEKIGNSRRTRRGAAPAASACCPCRHTRPTSTRLKPAGPSRNNISASTRRAHPTTCAKWPAAPAIASHPTIATSGSLMRVTKFNSGERWRAVGLGIRPSGLTRGRRGA